MVPDPGKILNSTSANQNDGMLLKIPDPFYLVEAAATDDAYLQDYTVDKVVRNAAGVSRGRARGERKKWRDTESNCGHGDFQYLAPRIPITPGSSKAFFPNDKPISNY